MVARFAIQHSEVHIVKRACLFLLAVVLLACHRHAPAPSKVDAGTPMPVRDAGPPAVPHAPGPDPTSAMARTDAGAGVEDRVRSYLEAHRPKPLPPPPKAFVKPSPDAEAEACGAKPRDAQVACFADLLANRKGAAPKPDAGAHLLGSAVRPPPICPAWAVANWYFSPSGNDGNSCTTIGSPCLTPNEVLSRYGCGGNPVLDPQLSGVTWNILGDMPYSSHFELNPRLLPGLGGGGFVINVSTTTIASGTLSGVVPKRHATSQALNANLGSGAASYYGMQIVNTTHPSQAWVDKIVSGNVALITQPISGPTTAIGSGPYVTIAEVDTWANGDSYNIVRPSKFYMDAMHPIYETFEGEGNYPFFGYMPEVVNGWLADDTGNGLQGTFKGVNFVHSRVDMILNMSQGAFKDSFLYMGPAAMTEPVVYAGMMSSQFTNVNYIVVTSTSSEQQGGWWFDDAILHGLLVLNPAGSTTFDGSGLYCDNNFAGGAGGILTIGLVFPLNAPSPYIYGNCTITQFQNGFFSYLTTSPTSPSSQIFGPGVVLVMQDQNGTALAIDRTHAPALLWSRPFTAANLFTTLELGGFGGIALPDNLNGGYYNWGNETISPSPTNVVWDTPYGGTGLDAGVPDGDIVTGGGPNAPFTYVPPIVCPADDLPVGTGNSNLFSCSNPQPTNGQTLIFNTPSPSAISDIAGWWESTAGVHLSGSNVTQWDDQSGAGINVTNTGSYPTYSASGGPNGLPYLSFASAEFLQSTTNVVSTGHDRSVWVVAQTGYHYINSLITFKLSTPYLGLYYHDLYIGTQYLASDGVSYSDVGTFSGPAGVTHLFQYDYHAGSIIGFYIDGVAQMVTGGVTASDTGTSGVSIGKDALGEYMVGNIEEIIVSSVIASAGEDAVIGGYVENKYGLSISGASGGWGPITPPWLSGPVTKYAALLGGGGSIIQFAYPSTAGYPLTSNGATSYPTFQQLAYSSLSGLPTLPTVSAGNSGITVAGGPAYTVSNADTFASGAGISVTGGPTYTVSNTGVTSAVAGTGIGVSGATGAVTISNTGVTSVAAGSGINVSASTGGVTISNTALFTNNVPSGATGFTSCLAGDFVQGQGTSPLSCTNVPQYETLISGGTGTVSGVGPGSSGQPLVSNGGFYPSYQGLNPVGGGTGRTSLASGTLLVGNGTGAVTQLSPGTAQNVATSNGSTWISAALPSLLTFDSVTNNHTLSNTSVTVLASLFESGITAAGIEFHIAYFCAGDTTNNIITLGLTTDSSASIVDAVQANLYSATAPLSANGYTYINVPQELYITPGAGSHTFYFLAQLLNTPISGDGCTVNVTARF